MNKTFLKIGVIAATLLASQAHASIMQYQYTGTSSGTIGANTFTDLSFVINQLVDTANIQSCGSSCSLIDDISTTITFAGLGTYTFATDLTTFDNAGWVGLTRTEGFDLYDAFNVGTAWDMTTATELISDPSAHLLQWNYSPSVLLDNGERLIMTSSVANLGTFQAISAVPEPEQWAMMLLGLPLMGWIARRKKNQAQC